MPEIESWKYSLSIKVYFVAINGEDHITVALLLHPFTAAACAQLRSLRSQVHARC